MTTDRRAMRRAVGPLALAVVVLVPLPVGAQSAPEIATFMTLSDCRQTAVADADGDGFSDTCEFVLAQKLAPAIKYDPDDAFTGGRTHYMVHPLPDDTIRIVYMPSYYQDSGWYLSAGTLTEHLGDGEFVALDVKNVHGDKWQIERAYLSSHYRASTDNSQWYEGEELSFHEDRLLLLSAYRKHGFFTPEEGCTSLEDWCAGSSGVADDDAMVLDIRTDRNIGSANQPLINVTCYDGMDMPCTLGEPDCRCECFFSDCRNCGWQVPGSDLVDRDNCAKPQNSNSRQIAAATGVEPGDHCSAYIACCASPDSVCDQKVGREITKRVYDGTVDESDNKFCRESLLSDSMACHLAPLPAGAEKLSPLVRPRNGAADTGDPHLVTFDGLYYDMQAVGELTLLRDASGDLEVQTRTRAVPGSRVAINIAVAARVSGDRVGFYTDGVIRLNGATPTFKVGPNGLPGGGTLHLDRAGGAILVWPDNTQLYVQGGRSHFDLRMLAPDSRRNSGLHGLLGDFDGEHEGDLISRGGAVLPEKPTFTAFYQEYVESWRVTSETTLFDYAPGEDTETFTDRSFPAGLATVAQLSEAERTAAEGVCAAANVHEDWLDACVLDVGVTGDPGYADSFDGLGAVAAKVRLELANDTCSTVPIDGYELVETLQVPADGTPVQTVATLGFGAKHKLRVSGTITASWAEGGVADAEYANLIAGAAQASDLCSDGTDFGLGIDSTAAGTRAGDLGPFCITQSYTKDVVGAGAPLTLRYHPCTADSTGSLTVALYAPASSTCAEPPEGGGGNGDIESVVLYSNNFEHPNSPLSASCDSLDGRSINTLYGTAQFVYAQAFTVEGVIVHSALNRYTDPEGKAGNAAIGMLSTVNNDLLALTFATPELPYLNVGFDLSAIDVNGCGGPFGVTTPAMQVSLYETPNPPFSLGARGTLLGQGTVTGTAPPNQWTFAWKYGGLSFSINQTAASHVTLVFDLLMSGYGAFDNLSVVASNSPDAVDANTNGVPDGLECGTEGIRDGFEFQVLAYDAFTSNTIPDWIGSDYAAASNFGVYNPPVTFFAQQAPEGSNVAYIERGSIHRVTPSVVTAGTTYRLSAKLGDSLVDPTPTYAVELRAGSTVLASTSAPALVDGQFVEVELEYAAGAADPAGTPIEIWIVEFTSDKSTELYIDEVVFEELP